MIRNVASITPSTLSLPLAPLLLIAVVTTTSVAHAGDYVHTVSAGETLSSIATAYYGSSWKSVYIVSRNSLPEGKEVAPGTRLVIPASFTYKIRRGDSLAVLAKKLLGDGDRYKAIMQENGIRDAAGIDPGVELLLPFHLRHTVDSGEGYSQIARRYYRNSKKAGLIKDYNGGVEVKAGDRVTIPIFDRATLEPEKRRPKPPARPEAQVVAAETAASQAPTSPGGSVELEPGGDEATAAVTPGAGASEAQAQPQAQSDAEPVTPSRGAAEGASTATPGSPPSGTPSAAAPPPRPLNPHVALKEAVDGFRRGDFDLSCPRLEGLLAQSFFSPAERSLLVSHLAFCSVAAGDRAAAHDYFRKWLELEPAAQLDPIETSPKILEAFQEVAATMRAGRK